MHREDFISTPLVKTTQPLRFQRCLLHFGGQDLPSYVEGPSAEKVDQAFDIFDLLADPELLGELAIPGISVQVRNVPGQLTFPDEPRDFKRLDWHKYLAINVPKERIPCVSFSDQMTRELQIAVDRMRR
ncbi:hypothetical protein LCGC14_3073930 [marine sediment metagenome]|uniref:Uncharacterized protein n=1 Tax=marine sediment metagenome TaxID=412755 RepID=A0A0F8X3Q5_9ZZZZ